MTTILWDCSPGWNINTHCRLANTDVQLLAYVSFQMRISGFQMNMLITQDSEICWKTSLDILNKNKKLRILITSLKYQNFRNLANPHKTIRNRKKLNLKIGNYLKADEIRHQYMARLNFSCVTKKHRQEFRSGLWQLTFNSKGTLFLFRLHLP